MSKVGSGASNLKVPLRKVSHKERVDLGREIASHLIDTYKDAVLAIWIYGSTAKKLDRPYSDLEVLCVVADSLEVANKFYVYHGLLVEIDYSHESNFLKSAAKLGWDWPIQADEYRNRIMLFDRDNWLKKLEKAVEENDRTDLTEEIRRACVAMTESLATVRNASIKGDPRELKTRAFYLAWDTARVVFLCNRQYVLTTGWFWKQLFECHEKPKRFRELIDTVAGFAESGRSEIVTASEELWLETMKMVGPRRVSIESRDIIV